jgi:hypothetical protein
MKLIINRVQTSPTDLIFKVTTNKGDTEWNSSYVGLYYKNMFSQEIRCLKEHEIPENSGVNLEFKVTPDPKDKLGQYYVQVSYSNGEKSKYPLDTVIKPVKPITVKPIPRSYYETDRDWE